MDSFEYNSSSFHKIKASCVNPPLRHVQIENIIAILNRVSLENQSGNHIFLLHEPVEQNAYSTIAKNGENP